MAENRDFWVRVQFPDGSPNSLRIATKGYWTGRVLGFPRKLFDAEVLKEDLKKPGVYVLRGRTESEDERRMQIYVGRAEPGSVADRLRAHNRSSKKAFWEETAVIVSATPTMPVPAKDLEAQLIDLAKAEEVAYVDQNSESLPPLSPMDKADALSFLEDALLCLRALGFPEFGYGDEGDGEGEDERAGGTGRARQDWLASARTNKTGLEIPDLAEYVFHLPAKSFTAFGRDLKDRQFQVLPGSHMAKTDNGKMRSEDAARREELLSGDAIDKTDSTWEFRESEVFVDRIQAKAVIRGSSRRGPSGWWRIASPELAETDDTSPPQ